MDTAILLPVKFARRAKSRLAEVLGPEERALLSRAMLSDVARALRRVRAPVVVVTGCTEAADFAVKQGWRVIWEEVQISESASVDSASLRLSGEGVVRVLRIPSDIPLISAEDVDALLDVPLGQQAALLVPSHDFLGTNALLRRPPCLFPSRFGHNSLVLHTQEALRAGAEVLTIESPRIALDIDDASDLRRFVRLGANTETYRVLTGFSAFERMAASAS